MENYIENFNGYDKSIVYNFQLGWGGIGDFLKFFMIILAQCVQNNIKMYHKINDLPIEKYIKLKYKCMSITSNEISKLKNVAIRQPQDYYSNDQYRGNIHVNEVFYFDDLVKQNVSNILPYLPDNYISIHLRLGDKFLETDQKFIHVKHDTRQYSEDTLYKFIEGNSDQNILFFCDNNSYKQKIKKKYHNIIITDAIIGHTSLSNTTEQQTLDAVTDFYLLSNSQLIYAVGSNHQGRSSGFSKMAAIFHNIKYIE